MTRRARRPGTARDARTVPALGTPTTTRDRLRQALLLGPGVALSASGLVSLAREPAAAGRIVLAVGLTALLAFVLTRRSGTRGTVSPR